MDKRVGGSLLVTIFLLIAFATVLQVSVNYFRHTASWSNWRDRP